MEVFLYNILILVRKNFQPNEGLLTVVVFVLGDSEKMLDKC